MRRGSAVNPPPAAVTVCSQVIAERARQDAKWGEQNHPDGTGGGYRQREAIRLRHECDNAAELGTVTYAHILEEEVAEALAEEDPIALREELLQVAAVAVAWVEAIDRRNIKAPASMP